MRLPWRTKTQEKDPYWDFFVNSAPADERNSLLAAIRNAPEGVVKPVKDEIHTPEVMARHTKELAAYLGADVTGIARTDRPEHPFAVLIGMRAEHDPRSAPGIGGQLPIQQGMYVVFILSAWMRGALRTAPARPRLAGAVYALATAVLGATVSVQAQMAVLVAGVVAMLVAERRWPAARWVRGGRDEGRDRALHAA